MLRGTECCRRLAPITPAGRSLPSLIGRLGAGIGGIALALALGAPAAHAATFADGGVYARVTAKRVVLGNGLAERRWARQRFRTVELTDKRGGGRTWARGTPDFTLNIAGALLSSTAFKATRVAVTRLERGGLRVTITLARPPGPKATRTAEAYPAVAGFRTQTVLEPSAGLALSGATFEQAGVGKGVAPAISAFRAGSDWREPGYTGPPVGVGDQHPGDWRDTRSGPPGQPLEAPGEWLSAQAPKARSLFMAAEENDFPSSRARYDGNTAALELDF